MNDEIWLTTALDGGRSRNVLTVDYRTGKIIRNKTLYTVDKVEPCNGLNSYATPTPILEDDRVYVTFGAPGTACLSARTAEVIWQRTDFNVTYFTVGAASTPSIHKNTLILICDGERKSDHFVTALDKMTGETLWKTDRTYKDGKTPQITHSFSVPLVITVEGRDQIICPGAHGVQAYDFETGREIWVARHKGWSVVARPVYADGLLYICCGTINPMMFCIDPKGAEGDITETDRVVWSTEKGVPSMPSPLLAGTRFYSMTASKLACRDPRTGEIVWNERVPGEYLASPVVANSAIYLFNTNGGSAVVRASDDFQMIATNELESGCMASPAIYGKSLIVRTKTHLYRIEEQNGDR